MNCRLQPAATCRSRPPMTALETDSQIRAPITASAAHATQTTADSAASGVASNFAFLVQRTSANSPASASSSAASTDGCIQAVPPQPGPPETMERKIPSSPSRAKEQVLAQRRIERPVRHQQVVIQPSGARPLAHLFKVAVHLS